MGQRKQFVIVDRQVEYGLRMADWIGTYHKDFAMCFVLRDIDELVNLVSKQTIDVLVMDGGFKKEFQNRFGECLSKDYVTGASKDSTKEISDYFKDNKEQIWWLQEHPSKRKQELYRYQNMQDLFEQIQSAFDQTEKIDVDLEIESDSRLCRNVAMIPATDSVQLRSWMKNTYGSDAGQSFLWYICFGNDEAYSDESEKLLYAVKMKNQDMLVELGVLEDAEKSVICPVRSPFDYRELGEEEVQWFFHWINERNYSSFVYLDVGLLKDEQIFCLFDEVWIICDEIDGMRERSIDDFLQSCGRHTIRKICWKDVKEIGWNENNE